MTHILSKKPPGYPAKSAIKVPFIKMASGGQERPLAQNPTEHRHVLS
jgi:hypothetical protein